jgi:hypothetical protein
MADSEELDYISSVDPFQAEKNNPSVDVADEKTLVRLMRVVDEQIELYHTISGVNLFPKQFSADVRLEMADHQVKILLGYKSMIDSAINGIKEKANG